MLTALRSALVVTVALVLAGCSGGGSTPAASSSPSVSPSVTASVSPASPADQQAAIQAMTSILVTDNSGSLGLNQTQAQCVAKGFVDTFGVQGLVDMGMLTSSLAPATTGPTPQLTAAQASSAADAMLACVNASDFVSGLLGGSGVSQTIIDCISSQLGQQGVHDVLAAVFASDQTKLQSVLLPVMAKCQLSQTSPG